MHWPIARAARTRRPRVRHADPHFPAENARLPRAARSGCSIPSTGLSIRSTGWAQSARFQREVSEFYILILLSQACLAQCRILLNAATVLSLVLCVAVIVLWVRSYRAIDVVARAKVSSGQIPAGSGSPSLMRVQLFSVGSGSGRICFAGSNVYLVSEGVNRVRGDGAWHFDTEPASAQWPYPPGLIPGVGGGTYWDTMGFGRRQQAWTGTVLNVSNLSQSVDDRWLPHWLLAVITAIQPRTGLRSDRAASARSVALAAGSLPRLRLRLPRYAAAMPRMRCQRER